MFESTTAGIRQWVASLFASAIKQTSRPEDRHAAIQWLLKSRDILASDLGMTEKLKALNALVHGRAAVSAIAAAVADAVKNYRTSKLPWPMKVAMPATLAAIPLVGLHGAGIAAFGSAIGLPVLLLVFLGTAGIHIDHRDGGDHPEFGGGRGRHRGDYPEGRGVAAHERRLPRGDARGRGRPPRAAPMPDDEVALRAALLAMDPFDFERHVMSFFEQAGLYAVVTPRSNDFGMDGYAAHPKGLIVVQCKRYAPDNKVGRPALQQFASVIRDQGAWRGYVVTASTFSRDAIEYAAERPEMVLIDVDALMEWQILGLEFEPRSSRSQTTDTLR